MLPDRNATHRRISDRAYALWVEEGQPTGRDVDHWLAAEHEIAATEQASPGAFRARSPRKRKPAQTER